MEWTDRQMDRQNHDVKYRQRRIDRWTNRQINNMYRWIYGQLDIWTDGYMDRWTYRQIDRQTYSDGQTDGQIERWEKNDRLNNKQFGDQYKHKINKR